MICQKMFDVVMSIIILMVTDILSHKVSVDNPGETVNNYGIISVFHSFNIVINKVKNHIICVKIGIKFRELFVLWVKIIYGLLLTKHKDNA